MRNEEVKQNAADNNHADRAPYETPAIIYEGLITTRAGTIISGSESSSASESGASPENIFSSDN